MPLQAKANGLTLCPIPPELSGLNLLELRLISLRVPFMKMVALPSGKQRSIHGPAVNVPSKVDTVCTVLPRLPSQTELIPLKLKRKLTYRGHYMYNYITPEKVLNALRWLKANNLLYADIEINDEWLEQSRRNDEELFTGIVQQTDNGSEPEMHKQQNGVENSTNSVNNDCEPISTVSDRTNNSDGDESMECCLHSFSSDNLFTIASSALEELARENGFLIHDVPYDGNCMFSAIAYQLKSIDICSVDSSKLREMLAKHLEDNSALYSPFLSQLVTSDDAYNAHTEPPTDIDAYIDTITDSELQSQLRWEQG